MFEDEDEDEDDDLPTHLPARTEDSALSRRAARVARQKLPSLPSKGDVAEGAVLVVILGMGAMVAWSLAWSYLGWMLWFPFFLLKAAAVGAGVWGAWWIYSRLTGGSEEEGELLDEDDEAF